MAEPNALRLIVQGRPLLGSLLRERDLLTAEELEEALLEKETTGERLGAIIVRRGLVSSRALAETLAEQYGLEFLDVNRLGVDPTAAAQLSESFAHRYRALPLAFRGKDRLLVAVADPTDLLSSDDLRIALGAEVELGVADAEALEHAIGLAYREELDVADAPQEPEQVDVDEILLGGPESPPAVAYEVLSFDERIRSLVDATPQQIHEAAVAGGMETLRDDGRRLCLEGITSAAEVARMVGARLRAA